MDLSTFGRLKGFRMTTLAVTAFALIGLSSCKEDDTVINDPDQQEEKIVYPAHIPPVIHPANNPTSAAKVELGRRLFYDKRMSFDNSKSCGSCHDAAQAFADAKNVAIDRPGAQARQAMPVMNVAWHGNFVWDGNFHTLEAQVEGPFKSRFEFNQEPQFAIVKLEQEPLYKDLFIRAYGDQEITMERISKAIAAFERTMISAHSPYDEYLTGSTNALNESAKRGLALFMDTTRTNCLHCHDGDGDFSDGDFHSTGLESHYSDGGRETLTGQRGDNGKFRTPTLRNIGLTAPYMHDGRFSTLMQVIQHYNEGGHQSENQDPHIRKLDLTQAEMEDLREFLESLTDDKFTKRADLHDPWK